MVKVNIDLVFKSWKGEHTINLKGATQDKQKEIITNP